MLESRTAPSSACSEKGDLLRRSMVFRGVGSSALRDLESVVEMREYDRGAAIFRQASPCTAFLLVAEGMVKVSICSSSGRQITYLLAERGEPLNLVGPFTGEPRLLAASALVETRVASIPQKPFLEFVHEHPVVLRNIMYILGQAIDSANGRIIDMFEKPVDLRLRRVLHTLYGKFGNPIPLTSFELAELTGTTTESTLRAMGRLRRNGIVRSGRGEVFVLDLPKLEEQCDEPLWI